MISKMFNKTILFNDHEMDHLDQINLNVDKRNLYKTETVEQRRETKYHITSHGSSGQVTII